MKILILVALAFSETAAVKTQEVHFDGSQVDGKARLPNGSNIVEARLKEILPLFELEAEFQNKVYESIDHTR